MEQYELIATTLFGLEALCAKEIRRLGYETLTVTDGRVTFLGDAMAVCRANLWLRTAERVFIKIGSYHAESFEELFDGCAALNWPDFLPKDAAFPVKGFSIQSALTSIPDCQAILKKSIVKCMSATYGIEWFAESGSVYQVEFSILKNEVTLMIDTSGNGLHKRGYRENANAAPLRETLAAAIAILSRFSYHGILCDPFCGSGTIPIEAGLIAKNIAPGLLREFRAQSFWQFPKKLWDTAIEEAVSLQKQTSLKIYASDIDPSCVKLTKENSQIAGVSDMITVDKTPVQEVSFHSAGGTLLCNPPYGERMLSMEESEVLYQVLGRLYKSLSGWTLCALSPHEHFEHFFGKKATKRRKLYNGMIKCCLYQYFPPSPINYQR